MNRYIAICLLTLAALAGCNSAGEDTGPSGGAADQAALVNPFVGTEASAEDFGTGGGAGNTYPGAVWPFGMLQFSPDTYPSTTNFVGGYTYSDTQIKGFSLTHLSGAGCALYQDISILPTRLPVTAAPVAPSTENLRPEYRSAFSHDDERAEPGYYQVRLNPETAESINVELTATPRAGLARFTPMGNAPLQILINAGASAMANKAASIVIDPAQRRVTGHATSGRFCYLDNTYTVYFAAEFDQPFAAHATWQRDMLDAGGTQANDTAVLPINYKPIPGGPGSVPGDPSGTAQAGAVLNFDATAPALRMRVAISFVSVENALENLHAELPHWDFEATQQAARMAWNRELSRIEVAGGSETQRRMFYTALYHALVAPNIFSDVNGEYLGFDGSVHRAEGYTQYHNFSGWDIYRSQIPLLAMIDPARMSQIVRSLLAQARESGGFLPKWSYANQHANVMVGDPAGPIIASAHAFGARDFDTAEALALMLRGAREYGQSRNPTPLTGYVQRPGLIEYQALGYIPLEENIPFGGAGIVPPLVWGTAATTLEYALADFSIGAFAQALGRGAEAAEVSARAEHWRALLNPASGYLEPRSLTGLFNPLYDPASDLGYVEGSGAQYSWMVPHNLAGLIEARGGRERVRDLLDAHYANLNAGPQSAQAFLGNEPGLSTPWLYAWLGQPWKTSAIVQRALNELYADTPGGMPGNDDLGTMSAWWVLAALGLNPAIPGTDVLTLNAPLFERIVVRRASGDWMIETEGAGEFIERAMLGERALNRAWLNYAEVAGAMTLRYRRTKQSGAAWGSERPPPSFGPGALSPEVAP